MKFKKGFTLIELLIVVLILGALAAIAIPRITESADTAKKNGCLTNVDIINTQAEIYAAKYGSYPATVQAMIDVDSNYFPEGVPVCPVNSATGYAFGADHRIVSHGH